MISDLQERNLYDHTQQNYSASNKVQIFITLLLCICFVFCILYLIQYINKPFKKININADFRYVDSGLIANIVKSHYRNKFFELDINKLTRDLSKVSGVSVISVEKSWSDATLKVNLAELEPIAIWNNELLINSKGEFFSSANLLEKDRNLPLLVSQDSVTEGVIKQYNLINQILKPNGFFIAKIQKTYRNSWFLTLKHKDLDSLTLAIGQDNIIDKLNRFNSFYTLIPETDRRKLVNVDLRYHNAIAVRWRTEETLKDEEMIVN